MSRQISHARAGQGRANFYTEITDRIIAELEAGRNSPLLVIEGGKSLNSEHPYQEVSSSFRPKKARGRRS